jgi:long-chain acyl-CoA synthetase
MEPSSIYLFGLQKMQADVRPGEVAVRYRRKGIWEGINWNEYFEQSLACAGALIDAHVRPKDRVALLSENRPEWLIADMGILAAGAVTVPIHATVPWEQVEFQLKDTGASWVFVSTVEQLKKVRHCRKTLTHLRGVRQGRDRGNVVG